LYSFNIYVPQVLCPPTRGFDGTDIQFHSQIGILEFGSFAYRNDTEKCMEVIGNIYDNPELLQP